MSQNNSDKVDNANSMQCNKTRFGIDWNLTTGINATYSTPWSHASLSPLDSLSLLNRPRTTSTARCTVLAYIICCSLNRTVLVDQIAFLKFLISVSRSLSWIVSLTVSLWFYGWRIWSEGIMGKMFPSCSSTYLSSPIVLSFYFFSLVQVDSFHEVSLPEFCRHSSSSPPLSHTHLNCKTQNSLQKCPVICINSNQT